MSQAPVSRKILPFRGAESRVQEPRLRPSENHLYFEAVASHGSIRKAAQALHIASSALNRRILDLEEELGTALFERLPRGVRPTAAGEVLLGYVRWSLRELEKVGALIEELKGEASGAVRLALSDDLGSEFLAAAIASYQTEHPGISFQVQVGGLGAMLEALSSDEVDLCVTRDEVLVGVAEEQLRISIRLSAVVSPDHELARNGGAVSLCDCLNHPIALSDQSGTVRALVDSLLVSCDASSAPTFETSSLDFLKSYLRVNRRAVGLVFRHSAERRLDSLRVIPLRDEGSEMSMSVVSRKGRNLPVAVASFVGKMQERSEAGGPLEVALL